LPACCLTCDYGWCVSVHRRRNETVIEHGGEVSGFLAENSTIPRTRTAVIVLSNADYTDPGQLDGELMSLLLKEPENVPKVSGPPPKEVALSMLHQMQAGKLERVNLGEEFSIYMTDDRVSAASKRLAALGEPQNVILEALNERGGMEVAAITFAFKTQ